MDNLEIKLLSVLDWQEYKEIRLESLESDPIAFGSNLSVMKELTEEKWKEKLSSDRHKVYAVQINGKIISIIAVLYFLDERIKHAVNLQSVYTKEEFRGKGIATKLLQYVLDILKKDPEVIKIKLSVTETQISAINLYKNSGFKIEGTLEKELKYEDKYFSQINMALFFNEKVK